MCTTIGFLIGYCHQTVILAAEVCACIDSYFFLLSNTFFLMATVPPLSSGCIRHCAAQGLDAARQIITIYVVGFLYFRG